MKPALSALVLVTLAARVGQIRLQVGLFRMSLKLVDGQAISLAVAGVNIAGAMALGVGLFATIPLTAWRARRSTGTWWRGRRPG